MAKTSSTDAAASCMEIICISPPPVRLQAKALSFSISCRSAFFQSRFSRKNAGAGYRLPRDTPVCPPAQQAPQPTQLSAQPMVGSPVVKSHTVADGDGYATCWVIVTVQLVPEASVVQVMRGVPWQLTDTVPTTAVGVKVSGAVTSTHWVPTFYCSRLAGRFPRSGRSAAVRVHRLH